MPAIAVPAFALTWWLAGYLAGRDPRRAALLRAAGALVTYAVGVAAWTIGPGSATSQVLLGAPALLWAGTAVALLPRDAPERRQIDRGWAVLSTLFLIMAVVLPPAGKLIVLAPLVGGLVLLWHFRDRVEPGMLPAGLTGVAVLYAAGLVVLLLPIDIGAPGVVLAAMGLDVLVLGYLAAVADAVEAGERLRPDLARSLAPALVGLLLAGGPAALTMIAEPTSEIVAVLQFALVGAVMGALALSGPLRRLLDRLALWDDDRVRADRSALLLVAEAIPRHRERHRLIATSEADFLRFTRRALDHFGDDGRLMRSPLTDLPAVDRRITGRAVEQPLARTLALRAVLDEAVEALRPAGTFATSDEWRHYAALHYVNVLGLRPYERKPHTDGLDRDARRAVDWMRRFVPRRRLRRWQDEGTAMVAAKLWDDMIGTDPRWLTRLPASRHS